MAAQPTPSHKNRLNIFDHTKDDIDTGNNITLKSKSVQDEQHLF